jgi:hypothetical protein
MFMRVIVRCAHQLRPPLGRAMTMDVLIPRRPLSLFMTARRGYAV